MKLPRAIHVLPVFENCQIFSPVIISKIMSLIVLCERYFKRNSMILECKNRFLQLKLMWTDPEALFPNKHSN